MIFKLLLVFLKTMWVWTGTRSSSPVNNLFFWRPFCNWSYEYMKIMFRISLNFFSGFLFATAKVAYVTAIIMIHLILHSAVQFFTPQFSSSLRFSYIHNFIIILSRVYNEPIQRPAPSWLVSLIGRALHRYHRSQGFESRTSLNIFQAFFSHLHRLRIYNCDDHPSFNCSVIATLWSGKTEAGRQDCKNIFSTLQVHKASLLFLPKRSYMCGRSVNICSTKKLSWMPLFQARAHRTPSFWGTGTTRFEFVVITCQIWPIRGYTRSWYTGTGRCRNMRRGCPKR